MKTKHIFSIFYLAGIFLFGLSSTSIGQSKSTGALVPACSDDRCGYIDRTGNARIQSNFDEAKTFNSGLAAVRQGAHWGFIDEDGSYQIVGPFSWAGDYSEDLAVVRDANSGLFGFIDKKGNFVISPKFKSASNFVNGLAVVNARDRPIFVNKVGEPVVFDEFESLDTYSGGFSVVSKRFPDGSIRVGYIDRRGTSLLPGWLTYAGRFSDDVAVISTDSRIKPGISRYGLDFDSFDYANFRDFELAYEVIDKSGGRLFTQSATFFGDFQEGLAAVCQKSKCGYVNKKGRTIIPFRYDVAGEFHEGRAQVKIGDSNFVIDTLGNEMFKVETTITRPFSNGMAPFVKCKHRECEVGYVDRAGKVLWSGHSVVPE